MIRAGLVGLGKMGISHCAILNGTPNIDLIAVCDTSKLVLEAMNKHTKIACFDDYQKMLDTCDLDCLVIATPTSSHASMARVALERGLHLFVEKPFCLNAEDGLALVNLATQKGLVTQVGYHNRFIAVFQEVKRLIGAGIIGEVYHFLGEAYGPVVLKEKGSTWRSSKTEGGGCLYDYAAHVINLVNFLVGPPDSVGGTVLKNIYSADVDDAVYSTLFYENGLSGQISVNWSDETYRKMSTQIEILGKKGKIIADRQELKVYLREDTGFENFQQGWNMRYITDLAKPVAFYLRGEEYSAQIEYFAQCIEEKKTDNLNSFVTAQQTDAVIELLKQDAAKRS